MLFRLRYFFTISVSRCQIRFPAILHRIYCIALMYGVWSELYLGYWSAVDILINPYHPDVASNGGALLHAFLDADVAVRHPKAFAYAEM